MNHPEPSQPNAPAPPPAPSISVSPKFLLQLLALLLAGGVTGGGISWANNPTTSIEGVAAQAEANGAALVQLRRTAETIAVTVVEMKADMRIAQNDAERLDERIKALERWREAQR